MILEDVAYEEGRIRHLEQEASNKAAENAKEFYYKHEVDCRRAFDYCKEYEAHKMKYLQASVRLEADEFRKMLGNDAVLVLTSNQIEEGFFLHFLYDLSKTPLESYLVGIPCFQVGHIGDRLIVHVHSDDTGEDSARRALNEAACAFDPSCIFLVGVCFGMDMERQVIGNTLVSNEVVTYRVNFRDGAGFEKSPHDIRAEQAATPDRNFVASVSNILRYLQPMSALGTSEAPIYTEVKIGTFFSGNHLVSSRSFKVDLVNQLGNRWPRHVGGEMEGVGLLKSRLVEEEGFGRWTIIKSICDWGEQKNQLDSDKQKSELIKDSLQAYAMSNSCGVLESIITRL